MFLIYLINIWKQKLIEENPIPTCQAGPLVCVHMENFHLTCNNWKDIWD